MIYRNAISHRSQQFIVWINFASTHSPRWVRGATELIHPTDTRTTFTRNDPHPEQTDLPWANRSNPDNWSRLLARFSESHRERLHASGPTGYCTSGPDWRTGQNAAGVRAAGIERPLRSL